MINCRRLLKPPTISEAIKLGAACSYGAIACPPSSKRRAWHEPAKPLARQGDEPCPVAERRTRS